MRLWNTEVQLRSYRRRQIFPHTIIQLCQPLASMFYHWLSLCKHMSAANHWSMVHRPLEPHDDVIKWKHIPRHWPFVRGIHRSPVNSSHKGQWRGALMFSLICDRINGWVNNRAAGDLRRHHAHYDVTVMMWLNPSEFYIRTLTHCGLVTPLGDIDLG